MELRNYQNEAIEQVRASMAAGNLAPVLVMPTGAGKTVVATQIVKMAVEKGSRVLFLAPRRELIYQATETFIREGIFAGMIMAGEPMAPMARVQVASFDTLHARAIQRDRIDMPKADLCIVDEAHLSIAATKAAIIMHYDRVIGLTATPARGDGRGLGEIYDDLVIGTDIATLTRDGFLVPVKYYAPSKPDLEAVKLNKDGDYAIGPLGEAMDKKVLVGDIVDNWERLAADKRTVVFCVNRKHSRHVCEEFSKRGYAAEHLDGDTPLGERAQILNRIRSGETQILCNVFVATYGLDIPPLECCVLARPTRNIALYLQTVGRVLRTHPNKDKALVIDHAGAVEQHGFVDDTIPWSLDEDSKVSERKEKERKEKKEPKDMTCPACGYTARAARICAACGHEILPPSEAVPFHEADLEEVKRKENRKTTPEDKAEFFAMLKGVAKERGYSQGWCSHKYRSKFGVWPNAYKHVDPVEPSEGMRNWVKSQQIAWAHDRKKKKG